MRYDNQKRESLKLTPCQCFTKLKSVYQTQLKLSMS